MFDFPYTSVSLEFYANINNAVPSITRHIDESYPLLCWTPATAPLEIAKLALIERNLLDIEQLKHGWDGYDAPSVKQIIISNALSLARLVITDAPAPEIYPTPDGLIAFEWRNSKGKSYLELGTSKVSFYSNTKEEKAVFIEFNLVDSVYFGKILGTIVARQYAMLESQGHGMETIKLEQYA